MSLKEKIIQDIENGFKVPTNLNLETTNNFTLLQLAQEIVGNEFVRNHLVLIEDYDQETYGHCLRTGIITADLYLMDPIVSSLSLPKEVFLLSILVVVVVAVSKYSTIHTSFVL